MQPDSSRPAARTPNVNFSDDMVYFQSKVLRSRRPICVLNATIPLISLSPKLAIIPVLGCLSHALRRPRCVFFTSSPAVSVSFLSNCALSVESQPPCCHRAAANSRGGSRPRHEALARIELSPVGWFLPVQFRSPHVLGVRPLRLLPEEGGFRRSRRAAGKRGLDRY